MDSNATTQRWMTHYSSSHKILLVGEGDFSFSACLARGFGSASSMVATSLDSEGHFKMSETHHSVIQRHKNLLSGFIKSSIKMLKEDGEVHVAHRDDHPYNRWKIEELANEAGLI